MVPEGGEGGYVIFAVVMGPSLHAACLSPSPSSLFEQCFVLTNQTKTRLGREALLFITLDKVAMWCPTRYIDVMK